MSEQVSIFEYLTKIYFIFLRPRRVSTHMIGTESFPRRMAAAGLPPAFRGAATSPNKEKEAGGAILKICVRRPFLRSGRRMGKPFDENRSRNCRRQSQHGPLGLGSRPSSPRVSSLASLIAKSRDSRPYTYASERLKDVPVWMANTAVDIVIQKRKARAFIGTLKRNNSSAVFARGIVGALFQSCAPRCDYHAVQSRPAGYQRFFARISRSDPLSLVD